MTKRIEARPISVGAMSIFFWAGAVISLIAALSLLFPEVVLEPDVETESASARRFR